MTALYGADRSIFEREVHRRISDGESHEVVAFEFKLPRYVIEAAEIRGNPYITSPPTVNVHVNGAVVNLTQSYIAQLLKLSHERPSLFFVDSFDSTTPVKFAETDGGTGPDTDDIADPFAPQVMSGDMLSGMV